MITCCRPNFSRTAATASGKAFGSAVLPGEHPHRDRAAVLVGEQPVLDLRLAPLAVPGVPVGGQLAVRCPPPRSWTGRTSRCRPGAGARAASCFSMSSCGRAASPSRRRPHRRGAPATPRSGPRVTSSHQPAVDSLEAGRQDPGDDQRVGQVPVPAGRAEQGREAELAGDRVHRGGVPVRPRPGDLERGVRVDERLAGQHRRGPRSIAAGGRARQVRQGFLADLAAGLAERAAQQPGLVLADIPGLRHMPAPHPSTCIPPCACRPMRQLFSAHQRKSAESRRNPVYNSTSADTISAGRNHDHHETQRNLGLCVQP